MGERAPQAISRSGAEGGWRYVAHMRNLYELVDAQALGERQDAILRLINRGGTKEVAKILALLSLLVEKSQQDCDINRRSLEFLNLPIARALVKEKPTVRALHITAEAPFDSTAGLHALEHDGSGTPFRWTGPTPQVKFEVGIDRTVPSRGTFRLLKSGHITRAYLKSVQIYLDGKSVPFEAEATETVSLKFEVPERSSNLAVTSIILECPVWSPSDTGSADTRQLGVAFVDLLLEPA